jgi:hypothetical protein
MVGCILSAGFRLEVAAARAGLGPRICYGEQSTPEYYALKNIGICHGSRPSSVIVQRRLVFLEWVQCTRRTISRGQRRLRPMYTPHN